MKSKPKKLLEEIIDLHIDLIIKKVIKLDSCDLNSKIISNKILSSEKASLLFSHFQDIIRTLTDYYIWNNECDRLKCFLRQKALLLWLYDFVTQGPEEDSEDQ